MSVATITITDLSSLELVEAWSKSAQSERVRFNFPISAETGATGASVAYAEIEPGGALGRLGAALGGTFGRTRIALRDKVALLAILLDDGDVVLLFDHPIVVLLMAGHHREPLRVRSYRFVLLARELDHLRTGRVFALA